VFAARTGDVYASRRPLQDQQVAIREPTQGSRDQYRVTANEKERHRAAPHTGILTLARQPCGQQEGTYATVWSTRSGRPENRRDPRQGREFRAGHRRTRLTDPVGVSFSWEDGSIRAICTASALRRSRMTRPSRAHVGGPAACERPDVGLYGTINVARLRNLLCSEAPGVWADGRKARRTYWTLALFWPCGSATSASFCQHQAPRGPDQPRLEMLGLRVLLGGNVWR
jgi:hypothetical protein